jgi:hypothetical protein
LCAKQFFLLPSQQIIQVVHEALLGLQAGARWSLSHGGCLQQSPRNNDAIADIRPAVARKRLSPEKSMDAAGKSRLDYACSPNTDVL